nr:hypothetical protein [Tanacetum cinerariifolium]
MGRGSAHGSAYGSAPVDDDSPVEEMSPVKAKKASKRASRAKKNDIKEKEPPKDRTKAEYIALCQAWCDRMSMTEAQKHRPIGRDCSKAKKKSSASSHEGFSSFVDLKADKYLGIKSRKWEKMQEQQDSYIQLKNQKLDIQEAVRKKATDLKREKLEI